MIVLKPNSGKSKLRRDLLRRRRVIAFGTEKVLLSHEEPKKESWVIFGVNKNNPPPIKGGG